MAALSTCDLEVITLMLRVMIGDLDTDCLEYTDERLGEIIYVAAKMVKSEVCNLCQTYSITRDCDTGVFSISPTPDETFADLIVSKAACMMLSADMRAKALFDGASAKCGPIAISTSSGSNAWQFFRDFGPCKSYEELKRKIDFKEPIMKGYGFAAILSPFISNTYRCSGCGKYSLNVGGCGCSGGSCSDSTSSRPTQSCTENNPESS